MRFTNLLPLARLLLDFSGFFLIRGRGVDRELRSFLERARRMHPGDLSGDSLRRLREYALLGVALGETFCVLRGEPMAPEEASAFLQLSVFAPFYDDLFDASEFKEARVLEIMGDPRRYRPENFFEALLTESLASLHVHAPDRSGFDRKFLELFEAQKEDMASARRNAQPAAPESALKKGGVSAQLYRTLLRHPLRPGEEEAFFRLGRLIQLMDDVFDVHEDHRAGRNTPATAARDMADLADWYRGESEACYARFRALSYRTADKRRFLFRVHFILSRGSVCLDRFLDLQRGNGGVFDPRHYGPGQLLVDMEKPSNLLRNLGYCLRFG